MPEETYGTVIERGYTAVNDRIIDFLKPRIVAPYLDVGCNAGWLLSEVPGGIGLEYSWPLAAAVQARGLQVVHGSAELLPFSGRPFATVVLSCVLEQCAEPWRAIGEAIRAGKRVIGINPIPGASPWGSVQGWVRSVLSEDFMRGCGFRTERMDGQRYFFEN